MITCFICLLALVNSGVALQYWDDDRLKSEVEHFSMYRGFASTVEANFVGDFIDIVGEQRNEMVEIQQSYRKNADAIIGQSKPGLTEKYEQLLKLRDKQDEELKKVLLPEQLSRLKFFKQYAKVLQQGFASSLVNGSMAIALDLSEAERIEAKKAAEKMAAEYRKVLIKAQKQAILRIRKSLPDEKRGKLDEMLKPLLSDDGTFWDIDIRMLDTSRKLYERDPQTVKRQIFGIAPEKTK